MAAESTRLKRKSKWDQPAPDFKKDESNDDQKSDLPTSSGEAGKATAAKAAAARLNAMLAAKGKIIKSEVPPQIKPAITTQASVSSSVSSTTISSNESDSIATNSKSSQPIAVTAEIEINDLISRTILCKGMTQDDINKQSGAAVSTKGRYISSAEKETVDLTVDRPLYLHVQAPGKENVHTAVRLILAKIKKIDLMAKPEVKYVPPEAAPPVISSTITSSIPIPAGLHYVQGKVFIGLNDCPTSFNLREKLQGANGSFFQHIVKETGAKVQLRGKGSGYIEPTSGKEAFEPLHIYINHGTYEGLGAAKKLCENLVETVKQQYKQFEESQKAAQVTQPYLSPYPSTGATYFNPAYPPPPQTGYQNYYGYPMYGHQQIPTPVPPQIPPNPYTAPYGHSVPYGPVSHQPPNTPYPNYYGYTAPVMPQTDNTPAPTYQIEEPPSKKTRNEEDTDKKSPDFNVKPEESVEKIPNLAGCTGALTTTGKPENTIPVSAGNRAVDVPDSFGLLGTGKSPNVKQNSKQNSSVLLTSSKDKELMPPPSFPLSIASPAPSKTSSQNSGSTSAATSTRQKHSTGGKVKSGLSSLVTYGSDSDEETSDGKFDSEGNNRLPFWAAHDYQT